MPPLRQQLSRLKTAVYRQPKDELQRLSRWGPKAYFRCNAWAREMEEAAGKLQKPEAGGLRPETGRELEVWFLTGKRFWYQTAFCAWTLAKQSGRPLVLNLVDDGSLEAGHEAHLRRLFPAGVTLTKQSVRERIETLLPNEKFPILRQRWSDYVNIRKLTDVHVGSTGVKLVLDSDMLFFRRPDALLAWWDDAAESETRRQEAGDGGQAVGLSTINHQPSTISPLSTDAFSPLLMTDCVESYGYSRELMEELAGAPIPPLLNVGMCGLRSEDLDWEELEHWCRTLFEREGTSYYLEQALVALLAARVTPVVMPPEDYITFPTRNQTVAGAGVLQHYVADSKPWYFGKAWKLAIES